MKLKDTKIEFEGWIKARGLSLRKMTGNEAVSSMMSFYKQKRVEEPLDPGVDGDMLLFQWSTYSEQDMRELEIAEDETFVVNITRQLIVPPGEDDNIWQLSLTLHFAATRHARRMKNGNRWCKRPDELIGFEEFVRNSTAYKLIAHTPTEKVSLNFGFVG